MNKNKQRKRRKRKQLNELKNKEIDTRLRRKLVSKIQDLCVMSRIGKCQGYTSFGNVSIWLDDNGELCCAYKLNRNNVRRLLDGKIEPIEPKSDLELLVDFTAAESAPGDKQTDS
jgi:hypothetical protein